MPVFDLDFTGDTTDLVDSGGRPPAGHYLCDLEDVFDDKDDPDKTHFTYVVVQGFVEGKLTDGFNGKKLFDKIEQPAAIESDQARGFAVSKIKIRAHRLGLWDGESAMKSIDFTAAIGARVVVETQLGKPVKEGKYAGQQFVEVKFDGIYPLTHKRCPACWKQAETTAANGAVAASEQLAARPAAQRPAPAQPAAIPGTHGLPATQTQAAAQPAPANLWEGL